MSIATYHAIERTRERTNYNAAKSEHFIRCGINRGKPAEMHKNADERNFLLRKETNVSFALAYNNYIFIIAREETNETNRRLITMYKAPLWFGNVKKTHYDGKKQKVRNFKSYSRCYNDNDSDFDYIDYINYTVG